MEEEGKNTEESKPALQYPPVRKMSLNVRNKKKKIDKLLDAFSERPHSPKVPLPFSPEPDFKKKYRTYIEEVEVKRVAKKNEYKFHITLMETPTIHLFSLPSRRVDADSEDAKQVQLYNEAYLRSKERKEWKFTESRSVQTPKPFTLTQGSQTDYTNMKDKEQLASIWDRYDSFREAFGKKKSKAVKSEARPDDGEFDKVRMTRSFQKCVMITERVLSSNLYRKQQMIFKTKGRDLGAKYSLVELWTSTCPEAEKMEMVNDICLNPKNPELIGVGYGSFDGPGLVCVWSIKCPLAPERRYQMESAVTSVSFARSTPRLLAAATYAGSIFLIDITQYRNNIVMINKKEKLLITQPVWKVDWYSDALGVRDYAISVGEAGEVWSWNPYENNKNKMIACLENSPYPSKKDTTQCKDERAPRLYMKTFSGLSLTFHPTKRDTYYVSTSEGCIIKCNLGIENSVGEVSQVSTTPVFGIQYSPVWDKIFVTYGYEPVFRIWMGNLETPLLEVHSSKHGVSSVEWSPSHPTVLVSVSKDVLALWDLNRMSGLPATTVRPPKGSSFTSAKFSPRGNNVLAGCKDGSLKIYNLKDMPLTPHLKVQTLKNALDNLLRTKPELAKTVNSKYNHDFP